LGGWGAVKGRQRLWPSQLEKNYHVKAKQKRKVSGGKIGLKLFQHDAIFKKREPGDTNT